MNLWTKIGRLQGAREKFRLVYFYQARSKSITFFRLSTGKELSEGMCARKPCVLIINGGQLHQRVQGALHGEGYNVIRASSYSRGIAVAHSYRPDLILLDMDISSTGTMSGLDCCILIRQSLPMPILAISVIADIQNKVRTLDMGADDYLVEPAGIDELLARVRALIRRSSPEQKLFQVDETPCH